MTNRDSGRRVLVIKWGALGDVVMAGPHLRRIMSRHFEDEVWLLTAPAFVELFAGLAALRIFPVPRRGVLAMARALVWARRQGFQVVYDLQGSERSALITWASRATRRVGLNPSRAYNLVSSGRDQGIHAFERLNTLLRIADIPAADPSASLAVSDSVRRTTESWCERHGLGDRPLVLLHAGASARWPSKRWPARSFKELATRLHARGFDILWLGGPDEAALNRTLAATVGVDGGGALGLAELAALASMARFAVTNDSGPMHLLAGGGLPVFGLFGPIDWRRSHAVGQGERVIFHKVECSPCYLPECPTERAHVCMAGISVDRVMDRLSEDSLL